MICCIGHAESLVAYQRTVANIPCSCYAGAALSCGWVGARLLSGGEDGLLKAYKASGIA